MNRTIQILLTLVLIGTATSGAAMAGIVDANDVDFVKSTAWYSTTSGEGQVGAWASAGIVSLDDVGFVTRDAGSAAPLAAAVDAPPIATVAGSDYRLIAGDGSPGSTCQIALVAAISPSC